MGPSLMSREEMARERQRFLELAKARKITHVVYVVSIVVTLLGIGWLYFLYGE